MSIKTFETIVNRVSPYVPGCPFPTIIQHIRDAAIDVCERTLYWRYKLPSIRLTPGVYDYVYELPTDTAIHAVITAYLNGRPLYTSTIEDLQAHFPDFLDYDPDKRGTPLRIFQVNFCSFGVMPIPDDKEPYELQLIVALKPSRSAVSIDDYVLEELEPSIVNGALSTLLLIPEKAWSNNQLAMFYAQKTQSKITERRARANLGNSRAPLSVKMRPLA
jgi:hypothetical protein